MFESAARCALGTNVAMRFPLMSTRFLFAILPLTLSILTAGCAADADASGEDDSDITQQKPCSRAVNWDGFTNGEGKLTKDDASVLNALKNVNSLVDGRLVKSVNTEKKTVGLKKGASGHYELTPTKRGVRLRVVQNLGDENGVDIEFKIQDFGVKGRYLAARITSSLDSWAVGDCDIAGEVFSVVTAVSAKVNK